ncbi:hypothetical protein [Aegicerativicinus sediminis]|uniref:hypothetical protein n=1 Tax=Aegicerativicinus sediminis TaxID=2893202 RepID=UPI001E65471E|nr:hypothetical protein [Aegicerativicinus sediminis]
MNGLIYILAILGIAFVIMMVARGLLAVFFPKPDPKNPYIQMHQIKDTNDKNYDEYLNWLDKKGHGVPIPKFETPEDKKAKDKINKYL